jgi:hypothetical protein
MRKLRLSKRFAPCCVCKCRKLAVGASKSVCASNRLSNVRLTNKWLTTTSYMYMILCNGARTTSKGQTVDDLLRGMRGIPTCAYITDKYTFQLGHPSL